MDGTVGLFSSASKNKREKHSWGEVINCFHKVINLIDEPEGRIIFENRGREKRGFRVTELLPNLWKVNDFTVKILELRTSGKNQLLAQYLQLLLHSKNFHQHIISEHNYLGFHIDGSGTVIYLKIFWF